MTETLPKAAENASDSNGKAPQTIEEYVELGKRAYALKQYEQSTDHYAAALELATEKFGEDALETADLYLEYGKSLLEHAVAQSAVLSKEEQANEEDDDAAVKDDPRFAFGGDEEGEDEEQPDVSLNEIADEEQEDEEPEGEPEADDDAPEDDFNAAWEVLELARVIYDKRKDDEDEIKLKLSDTYLSLGDVSLETEKFEQAIEDYTHAIQLKTELLPFSSRQVAEGHLKLALVLDITSGRLADAIHHVNQSIDSVEQRLSDLRNQSQTDDAPNDANGSKKDVKGKGKARKLNRDPIVSEMTPLQIENEIKDLEGMRQELQMKLDEIKTAPEEAAATSAPPASGSAATAPELAARALDSDLNSAAMRAAAKVALSAGSVNDLTGIVKKKKKPAGTGEGADPATNGLKRKATDDVTEIVQEAAPDKRVKLSEEPVTS